MGHGTMGRREVLRRTLGLGVMAITGAAAATWWQNRPSDPPVLVPEQGGGGSDGSRQDEIRELLRQRMLLHIDQFAAKDRQVVGDAVKKLDAFFSHARANVRPMVEDLTDYASTGKVLYKISYDGAWGTNHAQQYVAGFLRQYLRMPGGLERAASECRAFMRAGLLANEQRLYSELEPDLHSALNELSLDRFRRETSQRLMNHLTTESRKAVHTHLSKTAAIAGIDMVVTAAIDYCVARVLATALPRVLGAIAVRGGTAAASGTAVAVGASNSWWSFGISLVAGIIIGLILDMWLGRLARDEAVASITKALDALERESKRAILNEALKMVDLIQQERKRLMEEQLQPKAVSV